jgi:hypothetical protein
MSDYGPGLKRERPLRKANTLGPALIWLAAAAFFAFAAADLVALDDINKDGHVSYTALSK